MFGDQLVEVVRTDDEEESTSSFDSAENSKEAPVPRFSRWIHIHNYASDDVPAIAQKYLLHEITQADLIAVPRRSFASHRAHVREEKVFRFSTNKFASGFCGVARATNARPRSCVLFFDQ